MQFWLPVRAAMEQRKRGRSIPVLGLDIGDCLSNTKHQCADSEQWRTAETGAYAFVVLFTITHSPDSVYIFRNKCLHFAQQFGFEEMGVPASHILTTLAKTGPGGKGRIAKEFGLTHMVDNDPQCLWSVMCDPCGNAQKTLHNVILFTGLGEKRQNVWPSEFNDKLAKCESWLKIAKFFELPNYFNHDSEFDRMWELLSARGPPHMKPLGPTSLRALMQHIRDGNFDDGIRLLQQVPAGPAASAEAAPDIGTEEQEQTEILMQKAKDGHDRWRASSSESESESG